VRSRSVSKSETERTAVGAVVTRRSATDLGQIERTLQLNVVTGPAVRDSRTGRQGPRRKCVALVGGAVAASAKKLEMRRQYRRPSASGSVLRGGSIVLASTRVATSGPA